MGGYSDVVCRDERGTGKRQFAIWTQDESGIHVSPGYASMPPALQFVYAILILIAEGNASRILMAAPN